MTISPILPPAITLPAPNPDGPMSARWALVGRSFAVVASYPTCRYCHRASERDCEPVECLLCGSRQCHGNGAARGTCAICLYGWLPGWWREPAARTCGYAGCEAPAVARAPRVRRVCLAHASRVKPQFGSARLSLRHVTLMRINERNAGRLGLGTGLGALHWRWVA